MIFTRPRGQVEYVLKSERDQAADTQTVFLLTDLRERDRVKVMDTLRVSVEDDSAAIGGSGTRVYTALKCGLVGWRNAKYPDGDDVPFETEPGSKQPSDATLAMIPWDTKIELADAIMSAAFPDEDDKKK